MYIYVYIYIDVNEIGNHELSLLFRLRGFKITTNGQFNIKFSITILGYKMGKKCISKCIYIYAYIYINREFIYIYIHM